MNRERHRLILTRGVRIHFPDRRTTRLRVRSAERRKNDNTDHVVTATRTLHGPDRVRRHHTMDQPNEESAADACQRLSEYAARGMFGFHRRLGKAQYRRGHMEWTFGVSVIMRE